MASTISAQSQSTLDGLPKQFVSSLKVLFDILDEERTGLVRISDIETRWKDGEVSGLPSGVVDALKKVTPASGKLTFERFVAGLKIALLRKKGDSPSQRNSPRTGSSGLGPKPDLLNHDVSPNQRREVNANASGAKTRAPQPSAAPDFAVSLPLPSSSKTFPLPPSRGVHRPPTTAAVRPNNAVLQQRPASLAGLSPPDNRTENRPSDNRHENRSLDIRIVGAAGELDRDITPPRHGAAPPVSAPPLRNDPFQRDPSGHVPRTEPRRTVPSQGGSGAGAWQPTQSMYSRGANLQTYHPYNDTNNNTDAHGRNKDDVVFALKKWQQNQTGAHHPVTPSGAQNLAGAEGGNRLTDDQRLQALGRGPTEGRASIALASFDNYGPDNLPRASADAEFGPASTYRRNKKKEPRRHTLANGIDYNMIKRMKQLEQEKDILLQGVEAVERAREWYLQQVHGVQEKQKYISKGSSPNDTSLEANQERMNFQMTRIFEVNQQLKALVESSEKGYPLHMNLAVTQPLSPNRHQEDSDEQNRIAMLKAQNKMLTQELGQKNEKISQLEREKASLIRDMFDARANQRPSYSSHDDTTFL